VFFGFGGVKIKIKFFLATIIVFSLAMISISSISAADATLNATSYNSSSDLTAPTIKSISPANKATNVATNKVIKVTFSESIKKGNGYIRLKNSAGKSISITTSISGNVLTIDPTPTLTRGAKYYLYIYSGSIKDLSGNKYVYKGSTTFKTDCTAPTIKTISPANKATNVVTSKTITVTFSESIKKGTGYIRLKNSAGKSISIKTSISGNILTINPTPTLARGAKYYLYIHSGSIKDLSNNKYVYSGVKTFKTDGTAPTIKTISPTNQATNIAVNKVIKVTFSESIKKGTGTIVLKDSSGRVIAVTTSISGNVLTITPTHNLTNGTKYYLYLNSGSVTDLSNNKYVYKGSTTFKTKSGSMHAIWLPSSYVTYDTLNMTQLTKMGITDVFIKVSETNYKSVLTSIFSKVSGTGINVHAWVTCFKYSNGSWANPQNSTYVNSLVSFISSVTQYSVNGLHVSGIHLDYVRYPGTAYKYNGTALITAFVQKVYNTVKSIDSSVSVSAALMPEGSVNGYYYGQDYAQLAKYLSFMVIMTYKGNYGYDSPTGTNSGGKSGADWIGSTIKYIVSQAGSTPVIAGLQTYRADGMESQLLSASELQNDINAAINNGSSGYVLFRYGLIDDAFLDI